MDFALNKSFSCTKWNAKFDFPTSLYVDEKDAKDKKIYVTDYGKKQIMIFDQRGILIETIECKNAPRLIKMDEKEIFVVTDKNIQVFKKSNVELLREIVLKYKTSHISDIVIEDHEFYLSLHDKNKIVVLSRDNLKQLRTFDSEDDKYFIEHPTKIYINGSELFIVNSSKGNIVVINKSNGKYVREYNYGHPHSFNPKNMALYNDELYVYVYDIYIYVFDLKSGKFKKEFIFRNKSDKLKFATDVDMAICNGELLICDSNNKYVKAYKINA